MCPRDRGHFVKAGAQILQNFRGAWMLRRDIQPGGAQLHGDAVFAPVGEGALACRESGILTLADGSEFSAYRQYCYRLSEDIVVVEFADGPHIGTQFADSGNSPDGVPIKNRTPFRHEAGRDSDK